MKTNLSEFNPFSIKIKLFSFGVKAVPKVDGSPVMPPADYYVDARSVIEPSMNTSAGTGDDLSLIKVVENNSDVESICNLVRESIGRIPARRGDKAYDKPFVIGVFCAHGVHRSRATKHIIADDLVSRGYQVEVK